MPVWLEELKQFQASILGNETLPHGVCKNYPVEIALDVYRNNYRGNLRGALVLVYPVIEQIVGEAFFGMMSRKYIESHPSLSGNLHDYGEGLSAFLEAFPPAQSLEYLPDLAKLEWACHQAYFARDVEFMDIALLAEISPEDHPHIRFSINPFCKVVRSPFPIADIWNAHQSDKNFFVNLDTGAQNAFVIRRNNEVLVQTLSEEKCDWFERIQVGAPLWAATAMTMERHPEFDLQATLFKMVTQGILIDFDIEQEGE